VSFSLAQEHFAFLDVPLIVGDLLHGLANFLHGLAKRMIKGAQDVGRCVRANAGRHLPEPSSDVCDAPVP
jgi:hypothetical protein